MGDHILYPFVLDRQSAAAQALAEPLLGGIGAVEGAEIGAGAAGAAGALEGAEAGIMGGPVGMLAGAAIGAAGSAALESLAFRNRESTEQQDHFLDAQTLNGQNASVRAIRPRFVTLIDQRERNPDALRPRLHESAPTYDRMDADDDDVAVDYEPGRAQEPLRPTAARTPMQPRLTAQSVIDDIAASQPLPPEILRSGRSGASSGLGIRQRAGPSGGPAQGSYQDVLRPTSAPVAGLNPAQSLPAPVPMRRSGRGGGAAS